MNILKNLCITLISLRGVSIYIVIFFSFTIYASELNKVLDFSPVKIDYEHHESNEDFEESEFEFIPNKTLSSFYPLQNLIHYSVTSIFKPFKGYFKIFIMPPISL